MRIVIVLAIGAARMIYALLKLLPVRHKVVFLSRQSDDPSLDFTLLAAELHRIDPDLEIVVRCKFIDPGLAARVGYLGEVVAQMYHLATASACVLDGYIVPVSVLTHRPELVVVQMWHALGAIKQFGLQALGRPGGRAAEVAAAMKMHHNYDVVLCGSEAWVPAFAEAFGTAPDAILPLGLPRADHLAASARSATTVSSDIVRLRERFPILKEDTRPIVLYAPTYRRNEPSSFEQVIDGFANESVALVIKPHDLETASLAAEHVIDASGIDVLELIGLADVVVTDYSAVAFEACAAGKPLMFFVADIDEYARTVGLNLDPLAEAPSLAFREIGDLVSRIAARDYGIEASRAFCERFGPPTDGGCTRRIAEMLLARIATGEPS